MRTRARYLQGMCHVSLVLSHANLSNLDRAAYRVSVTEGALSAALPLAARTARPPHRQLRKSYLPCGLRVHTEERDDALTRT